MLQGDVERTRLPQQNFLQVLRALSDELKPLELCQAIADAFRSLWPLIGVQRALRKLRTLKELHLLGLLHGLELCLRIQRRRHTKGERTSHIFRQHQAFLWSVLLEIQSFGERTHHHGTPRKAYLPIALRSRG